MAQIKKLLFVGLTGVLGLLLTLAGLSLISLSDNLLLYVGITLLATALIYYFFN